MKLYYVHSKKIYDTDQESMEIAWLKQFGEVVNPNDGTYGKSQVRDFIKPVLECDRVVCSEYEKCIGRGAFDQILAALERGIPVFVLRVRRILGTYHLKRVKMVKRFLNNWNYYGTVLVEYGWNRQPSKDVIIDQMVQDDFLNFKGTQQF